MRKLAHGLLPILLFAGIGCGGGSSGTTKPTSGPYLPLKVGNQWTYTVTDVSGKVSAKVQGVTAETVVGGMSPEAATMAFKLVTGDKFDDKKGDVSYQNWSADGRLLRYREISVGASSGDTKKEEYYGTPFKLRVWDDTEHLAVGKSWPESYKTYTVDTPKTDAGVADADGGTAPVDAGLVTTEDMSLDVWTVVALDETVTVGAGTFKALVMEKVVPSSGSDKKFWFVRGIGKVKETGVGDQTEELNTYKIMP